MTFCILKELAFYRCHITENKEFSIWILFLHPNNYGTVYLSNDRLLGVKCVEIYNIVKIVQCCRNIIGILSTIQHARQCSKHRKIANSIRHIRKSFYISFQKLWFLNMKYHIIMFATSQFIKKCVQHEIFLQSLSQKNQLTNK